MLLELATMKLTDILTRQQVIVPLASTNKADALAELVQALARTQLIDDPHAVLEAVLQREQVRSTGIGNGLAIPHGKTRSVRQLAMAVGKPAAPIPFGSLDNRPVWFIVLLGSPPEHNSLHIQALARVSRMTLDEKNRSAFLAADSADKLYAAIVEAEAHMPA